MRHTSYGEVEMAKMRNEIICYGEKEIQKKNEDIFILRLVAQGQLFATYTTDSYI